MQYNEKCLILSYIRALLNLVRNVQAFHLVVKLRTSLPLSGDRPRGHSHFKCASYASVECPAYLGKKKGLFGKIKQMTPSRSVEDSITAASLVSAGMKALVPSMSVDSDSELSLDVAVEKKKEKKSVKDKLTGVFRRSASRSNR